MWGVSNDSLAWNKCVDTNMGYTSAHQSTKTIILVQAVQAFVQSF